MKKEDLFEAIGELDSNIPQVKKSMPAWLKITTVAACCAFVVATIRIVDSFNTVGRPTTLTTNAMITMGEKQEQGTINNFTADASDDKIIYEGAIVGTEAAQATTEAETSDIFHPWPDAENALKNNFDIYGGCYLDENQELVVLLTEDTPGNREKVCADMNVNMGSAKFKEVKYSKAYLDAIHEKITAVMINREFETIVTSGVMEMDNFVEVTLTEKDDKAIEFLNRLDNTGAINIVYGMVSTTAELITTK